MISATKLRNLLGLGAALGIWQLTVSAGWVNEFMMPSPMDVVKAIGALAADGSLREHLSESLLRVGMGYLIAAAIGLPIGFLCGMWKSASEVIRPVIEALRPIPPLAWVPIAILWFGLGDASAYFLVFLGCFFPMFFAGSIERNQPLVRSWLLAANSSACDCARRKLLTTSGRLSSVRVWACATIEGDMFCDSTCPNPLFSNMATQGSQMKKASIF